MRLLLLVFLSCSCTYARRAVFDCAQQEVIQKLKDDTTGFDKRIALLMDTLKAALGSNNGQATQVETIVQQNSPADQSTEEKAAAEIAAAIKAAADGSGTTTKAPSKTVVDLESLHKKLGALNEATLAEFDVNLFMDLFPEDNTKKVFAQIDAMLSDAEIEKAVNDHCKDKCQHPFPKLHEAKADNQIKLQSVAGSYSDRPGKVKVRGDVVSNLNVDFTQKLPHLISTIKYELPEDDAASILPGIPLNFSLPANFLEEVKDVKIPYTQENSKTLNELSKVLRAARSALAACQIALDRKGSPACRKETVPFLFVLDPSNMKAFDDMIAEYNARADQKAEKL